MALLRSQDMDLYQIQIHKDESWEVMNAFGKLGRCQFIDLNVLKQPHELLFTNNLRNMDQALGKIGELESIYHRFGVTQKPCKNIEAFMDEIKVMSQDRPLLFD